MPTSPTRDPLWAIVLAAGDGTRLRLLVQLLHDRPLPKQFAVIEGSSSLLQNTLDRVTSLVPPWRTIVVVSAEHEALARRQLAAWQGLQIVVQPRNLGTGPGILLPLKHLRAQAPDARVAIFPSDHHIPRPQPFLDAVLAAERVQHSGITLLGILADRPDSELGWIVPYLPLGAGVRTVGRFVEKPQAALAKRLWRQGSLWNSFVSVGGVSAFWDLARTHLPMQTQLFEDHWKHERDPEATLAALYKELAPADFSRSVLEVAHGLAVATVEDSGWSDWGSPDRIIQSLEGTAALDALLARILAGQRRRAEKALQPRRSPPPRGGPEFAAA